MMNTPKPKPAGSTIEEIEDFEGRTYRWKPRGGGALRYLIAAFLLFWLGGWAFGFVMVTAQLLDGKGGEEKIFLAFWLAMWTLGGLFAMSMAGKLLWPSIPESITLDKDAFRYDSGTSPPPPAYFMNPWYAMRHGDPFHPFGMMFKRRKRITIEKSELGNVALDRVGERQRLYFDNGADRIEIGEHLREPEREWLASVIDAWRAG